MNLHALLRQRARNDNPVKVGIIGAGKFSTMFISQARFTPGMQIVGIADLDSQKARQACLRTGWPESSLSFEVSTAAINDTARKKRTAITENAVDLIAADLDVIVEITGDPEAGTAHAWYALETGKHVIMVNVEADCLLGPILRKKAAAVDRVYSMAYGDQPAIIAEMIDWARTAGLDENLLSYSLRKTMEKEKKKGMSK
jgi:predicted homoserine dehydrogenase-like protein